MGTADVTSGARWEACSASFLLVHCLVQIQQQVANHGPCGEFAGVELRIGLGVAEGDELLRGFDVLRVARGVLGEGVLDDRGFIAARVAGDDLAEGEVQP